MKLLSSVKPVVRGIAYTTMMATESLNRRSLSNYRYFLPMQTRVADMDYYAHVNNSHYHLFTDTIVNSYLVWYCGLNTERDKSPILAYMVQTQCVYKKPLQFPQVFLAGLGIKKTGRSSVHYSVGLFEPKMNYQVAMSEDQQLDPRTTDPLLKLGMGSQGLLIGPHNTGKLEELEQYYHSEVSVLGTLVHSFVDSATLRPVSKLPETFLSNLSRILTTPEDSKL